MATSARPATTPLSETAAVPSSRATGCSCWPCKPTATPSGGPDHDEFDPDRFLPENLRKLGTYVYKPFGTGERACIGGQFAYHEILLALTSILHSFALEPEPGYRLDVRKQITLEPHRFRLELHRRT
ncbi:cytochrome P450 [Nocardia sp. NPDC047038]|uniref:cytochrome P450 n=1 Tax=Nocardia sp. NPDC047038 TaxID=3154338 RepID=UPI0033D9CADF